MDTPAQTKTLVVDGNNILARSVYAPGAEDGVVTSDGMNLTVLRRFLNMVAQQIFAYDPTHLLVAFDAGTCAYRRSLYPEYKKPEPSGDVDKEQQRQQRSQEMIAQGDLIREVMDDLYMIHYHRPNIEADDIIAATMNYPGAIRVMSSDKDLFQLVDDSRGVHQFSPAHSMVFTEAEVLARFGAKPRHVAAALALAGDASDNIPGLPRVGVKTAVKRLVKHDWNMESYLASLDDQDAALVKRNLELTRLHPELVPDLPAHGHLRLNRKVFEGDLLALTTRLGVNPIRRYVEPPSDYRG